MLDRLCETYGTLLGELDGLRYYAFPTLAQLKEAQEMKLRELGFGYRAKFIPKAIEQVFFCSFC